MTQDISVIREYGPYVFQLDYTPDGKNEGCVDLTGVMISVEGCPKVLGLVWECPIVIGHFGTYDEIGYTVRLEGEGGRLAGQLMPRFDEALESAINMLWTHLVLGGR